MFNNKVNNRLVMGLLLVGINADASNRLSDPYAITNRNPFVQIYGLPVAQSAQLPVEGELSAGLQIDIANNFTESDNADEQIFIDGETHRASLQLRYGFRVNVELGIDVPYLSHEGGGLDGFIENWHDAFGLPSGGRLTYPQDQFLFSYQNAAGDRIVLNDSVAGLGDISFSAAYQLSTNDDQQWALRVAVKLPTGDASSLLGSGSTDISLGLNFSNGQLWQSAFIYHGSAGVMFVGGGEVLDQRRKNWVMYGSSTLSWLLSSSISLKLQLDVHTAFYDSGLTELGSDAAQLIIGGTIRLSDNWMLDLAVSEDIIVDTAPDVVFHIGLKALRW